MKHTISASNNADVASPSAPIPHAISHRKKIGAFYTPLSVANILCNWAVRRKEDMVLEPCFGGCTFLEALITRFDCLQQNFPEDYLFGCDIDPLAFQYLETIGNIARQRSHFLQKDFLSVNENELSQKFDIVIGNPPYIRHSKFDSSQKAEIVIWEEKHGIRLNRRSSLWAYFIIHALKFLKEGGRVAWVLPATFLTSAYAKQVREIISSHFKKIIAITLTERLFIAEGTEEPTVVLLAEGFSNRNELTRISVTCVDTVAELEELIENWPETETSFENEMITHHGNGMLPTSAIIRFENLPGENINLLKQLVTIQIGLVTGNVPYFIKSKKEWDTLGIQLKNLKYIMPKTKWVYGISLDVEDESLHIENNIRCLALHCPELPKSGKIREYLNQYDQSDILNNSTFRKREFWHYFFDNKIPDAFMVFMTHLGPRMIFNNIAANCTNSVYRIFFNAGSNLATKKLAAISLNTTYSQFSAELLGQGRGAGALKLEPHHMQQLKLYMPRNKSLAEVDSAFIQIDQLLRHGKFDDARNTADNFIFSDAPAFTKALPDLEAGLLVGRKRRMRKADKLKGAQE